MAGNRKGVTGLVVLMLALGALLLPLNVQAGALISMSVVNENPQTANPGGAVTYSINITNNGDSLASGNLTTTGDPVGWTVQLSQTTLSVSAGSVASLSLTVGVPSNATADSAGKQVVVTWTYNDSGTIKTAQVTATTKVAQNYGFTFSAVGAFSKSVAPGSSVTYTLQLNQSGVGNGVNSINLTPTGQQPDGITISYSANPATVQPFATTEVVVSLFVPSGTQSGQYSYVITATSRGGTTGTQTVIANVEQTWGISLSTTEPVKNLNPDSTTTFNITLTNTGNKADTFLITSVDFSAANWTVSFTSSVGPVSPSNSSTVALIVYAPIKAPYPQNVQFKVNVESASNSSIRANSTVTAVINKVHKAFMSASPFIGTVQPGGTAAFNLTLRNDGNGQDSFDLSIESVPANLTPSFNTTSVTLAADATASVSLTVSVSAGTPVGDNNLKVIAAVRDTGASSNYTVITRIVQVYNVTLLPSGSFAKRVVPGNSVQFSIEVKNTGNGADTYLMGAASPSGLTTFFDKYSVGVSAGASQIVVATVDVARGTASGTYTVTANATSTGDGTKNASITLTVIVDQMYAVELSTVAPYNASTPGNSTTFPVVVRNTGSGQDNITLTAGGAHPSWVSFNRSVLTLAGGAQETVLVTVSVPAQTAAGDEAVTITAKSGGNSSVTATLGLTATISQVFGVSLRADVAALSVSPGESAVYTVLIKNTGNGNDTYYVNFTENPNNWARLNLTSPFVTLRSGETLSAALTVPVPSSALMGPLTVSIQAKGEGLSSAVAGLGTLTTVKAVYGVVLSSLSVNNSAEPTDPVQYQVRVKNTGNALDTITLEAQGSYRAWAVFSNASLSIGPGNATTVTVTLTPPDGQAVGNYSVEVRAVSAGNDSQTASLTLNIEVKEKHDVKVRSGDLVVLRKADPGTTINFSVNVTNVGPEQETVTLSVAGQHTDWAELSNTLLVLDSKGSQSITLSVAVPISALPEQFVVSVKGTLQSNSRRTDTLNLTVKVNQIYKLEVSALTTALEVLPGATANYTVSVKNTGTGTDNFTLTASNRSMWVTFVPASPLLVNMSETKSLLVSVATPANTETGVYNITVTITSVGNASVSTTVLLSTTVLQVYNVKLTTNLGTSAGDPGTNVSYTVTVKNTGNGADTFTLNWTGTHLNWGNISSSSASLAAGASTALTFNVSIPQYQPVETFTNTLNARSQGNTSVMASTDVTTTINLLFGVSAEAIGSTAVTVDTDDELGKSVNYTFRVRNEGNSNDTIDIEATGKYSDWAGFNATALPLAPGKASTVNATVNIPWAAPFDALNGVYTIPVKASSRGYSVKSVAFDTTTTVNISYALSISLDSIARDTFPNDTATYNLTLRNTGNVRDTYELSAITFTPWVTFINSSSELPASNYTIRSGYQEISRIAVKVPADQKNGNNEVKFEIKSSGNTTKKVSTAVWANVTRIYGVDLVTSTPDLNGGLGDVVRFTLRAKNIGNVVETVTLEILPETGTKPEWGLLQDTTLTVPPNSEKSTVLSVTVPTTDVAAGKYYVKVKATVQEETGRTTTLFANVTVSYGADVAVSANEASKKGLPGAMLTYPVTVKNTGTGNDTFDISKDDQAKEWATVQNAILLPGKDAKGASATVFVNVTIPADAKAGIYLLRIRAASRADPSRYDEVTLTVQVDGVRGVRVTPLPPLAKSEVPSRTVTFTARVTNSGNAPDTIELSSSSAWVTPGQKNISLDAGQYADVSVFVSIPSKTAVGAYPIPFTATSSDTTTSDTTSFNLTVSQVHDFDASAVESALTGAPGDNLTFTLKLTNNGNGRDSLKASFSGGEKSWALFEGTDTEKTEALNAGQSTTIQVMVSIPALSSQAKAGRHEVQVEISSIGNSSLVKKVVLTVTVQQKYGLTLSATASSATVDPGDSAVSSVNFDLTVSNTGNGDDTVSIAYSLPPDASSWSVSLSKNRVTVASGTSQTFTVSIQASSIANDAGTYQFSVTVTAGDGTTTATTSPKLSVTVKKASLKFDATSFTVSKRSGKVGDSITVTVALRNDGDADARNVVVQFFGNQEPLGGAQPVTVPSKGTQTVTFVWETDTGGEFTLEARAGTARVTYSATVKLTEEKQVSPFSIAGLTSNPMLLIGLLLVVVAIIAVAAVGMRRKPEPPAPEKREVSRETAVKAKEPASKGGAAGDGSQVPQATVEGVEDEEAPAAPPKLVKTARIKCPKCGTIKDVTDPVRPWEGRCDKCRVRLRLTK